MNFLYEAVDETGLPVFGKIDARSEEEAHRQLQHQGLRPQSLAPSGAQRDARSGTELNPAGHMSGYPPAMRQPTVSATAPASGANLEQTQVMPAMPYAPSVQDRVNASPVMQSMTGIGTITEAPRAARMTVAAASAPALEQAPRVGNITLAGNAARIQSRTTQAKATPPHLKSSAPAASPTSKVGGVRTRDMLFFFRQFASLVNSGITLYGALDNLGARTTNPHLKLTIIGMAEKARSGGMISDVMAQYPRIYPDHVVGIVRAGEMGGFIEIALDQIANNYDANIKLYRASWIPKLLATQAFFMFALAQPLFPTLFPEANIALYLKLVFLRNLPITFGLYFLIRYGSQRLQLPEFRRLRDDWSLRIPAFGNLQRMTAVATFLQMLRRLYHAGVAPIQAWEGAMNTATNVVIRERLTASYGLMQKGASLPEAFEATGLFSDQVEQLIFTGQQSGQVVEMLDQATDYYQTQLDEATGKARFMMLRLGILAALILGGGTLCWMAYSYFHGIFPFVDKYFSTDRWMSVRYGLGG